MPLPCVVFEDSFADRLRPINLARPTCRITCGAYSLQELLGECDFELYHAVRPHLRPILERDEHKTVEALDGPVLYVNASLLPDVASIEDIVERVGKRESFIGVNGQRIAAAFVKEGLPAELAEKPSAEWIHSYLLEKRLPLLDEEYGLFNDWFDVIGKHESLIQSHLRRLISRHRYEHIGDHVYVGAGCSIAKYSSFEAADGPIILGNNVKIKPFSYLAGPVRIGDRSIINDHASVKHATVIGHTVKFGGETEAVIVEPFSNKQHHGFLGHSYVGSWVNLGAGTSNSDLKNTYGEVSVDRDGRSTSTGLQFLGCVIGDYTKSAINTSIFTGKLIGVGSFLYGFVTTDVPSFTNYARSFGQVTEVGCDVAAKTQARAAQRRQQPFTEIDQEFFEDLFELTRSERQLSNEQVAL